MSRSKTPKLKWVRGADGGPVAYLTQAELAEVLGISTRWVMKLEERGLPAEGHRDTCRYPIPHALAWALEWRVAIAEAEFRKEKPPDRLSIEVAMARYRRRAAIELADLDYRLATDPVFRTRHEATS